ncbi:MAG: hypothetical protein H0U28_00290 [Nocardioidaceae bacterium]|nr:hypothetical protein [Nocardioidaceae bacterium]
MSTGFGSTDPVFDALDPLVRNGRISPAQADDVYRALMSAEGSSGRASKPAGSPSAGWQLPTLLVGVVVFGASLVMAGFLTASPLAENKGLVWKTFIVMFGVTAVFAVGAVGVELLLKDGPHARWVAARRVTGLLASLALTALALLITTTWDAEALPYLAGVLLLIGGVAGYWILEQQVLTLAAVLGGLIILGQVLSDSLESADNDTGAFLTFGMAMLGYGIAVALVGWRFHCRHLTAMLGGGLALFGMYAVVLANGFFFALGGLGARASGDGFTIDDVRTDIRIAMFMGLLIALALAAAYAYTSFVGFAVLSFFGAVFLPALTIAVTPQGQHPLRWAVAFAAIGSLVVFGAIGYQLLRGPGQQERIAGPTAPPPAGHQPSQYRSPYQVTRGDDVVSSSDRRR